MFTAHTDIEVSLGDLVEIVAGDRCKRPVDDFSFTVYNCTTSNPEPVEDLPAEGGLVYSATANCEVDPVGGTWSVGEGTGIFSEPTEFNTFFTPTSGFGVYEVCFTDDNCGYAALVIPWRVSTTPVANLDWPRPTTCRPTAATSCAMVKLPTSKSTPSTKDAIYPFEWPQAERHKAFCRV